MRRRQIEGLRVRVERTEGRTSGGGDERRARESGEDSWSCFAVT